MGVLQTQTGLTLAAFTPQVGDGTLEVQPDGVAKLDRHWECLSLTQAYALCPKVGALDAVFGGFRCAQSKVTPLRTNVQTPEPRADITATFYGILFAPPTIVEWTTNRLDRPIEQHPLFNTAAMGYPLIAANGTMTDDPTGNTPGKIFDLSVQQGGGFAFRKFAPTSPLVGIDTYLVASGQYKITDYLGAPDFDRTNLDKINSPPAVILIDGSIVSPPAPSATGNFLYVQNDCRNILKGITSVWERVRVWLYNDLGWNATIYT